MVEHSGKKLLILLVKLLCEVLDTLPPGGRPSSDFRHLLSTSAPFAVFGVTFLRGEAAVRSCPSRFMSVVYESEQRLASSCTRVSVQLTNPTPIFT